MFPTLRHAFLLLLFPAFSIIGWGQNQTVELAQLLEDGFFQPQDGEQSFYQKTSLEWTQIPLEIPGVSSRLIPGERDTGVSFMEERFGRILRQNEGCTEIVDRVATAGKVRHFQWMTACDLLWDWTTPDMHIAGMSTAPLRNPLSIAQWQSYEVRALGDSRFAFQPKPQQNHGFTGWVQLMNKSGWASQFTIIRADGLQLADSAVIYQRYEKGHAREVHLKLYLSALGYQGVMTSSLWLSDVNQGVAPWNFPEACQLMWTDNQDEILAVYDERPVPLSPAEVRCAEEEQIYQKEREQERYRDSLMNYSFRTLYARSLITGGEWKTGTHHKIQYRPLWYGLGVNTVEGIYYVARPTWLYQWRAEEASITTVLRYGFGDQRLRWKTRFRFAHLGVYRYSAELEFGQYVSQFNELDPIIPLWNSLYTVLGDNFMKLYERDFIRLQWQWEPEIGWIIQPKLEWARRSPLFNLPQFVDERDYTPNNPTYPGIINDQEGFRAHNALTFSLDLSYQFGQKYRIVRGRRRDLHSNLPKVYAEYRKGIAVNEESTDFDFLNLGVGAETDWGRWGFSRADLSTGRFFSANRVEFIDFKHFNGVQTLFLQSTRDQWSNVRQFGTLPYYDYSTARSYVEFHLDHDFRGTLWKEIPGVGHLNWSVISGLNYLYTEEYGGFAEWYFGLDRVLGLFRMQVMIPIPRPTNARFPVRFGMTIQHDFYFKNRRR